MEELQGGRDVGIYRADDKVYRPSGFWSKSIHHLFTHLRDEQFNAAPESFGFDENGNEILSYVSGEVYNYPLTDAVASHEALCSAAVLLRQYHDATVSFVNNGQNEELEWLLPHKEPQEVICHGDFAPYNVVLNGNIVVGIIDFDTAHPGPRIWDIAYAVYCWAPFKINPHDSLGNLVQQATRAKQFCEAYGLSRHECNSLVDVMILRLQALVDFMYLEADKGNEAFITNIKDGHHQAYFDDINYLKLNKQMITDCLA